MNRYIGRHKPLFVKALAAELAEFLIQAFSYFIQMKLINTVLRQREIHIASPVARTGRGLFRKHFV